LLGWPFIIRRPDIKCLREGSNMRKSEARQLAPAESAVVALLSEIGCCRSLRRRYFHVSLHFPLFLFRFFILFIFLRGAAVRSSAGQHVSAGCHGNDHL
jgi:hypothetical protein